VAGNGWNQCHIGTDSIHHFGLYSIRRKSAGLQWYRSAMRHTMPNGGAEVPASYNKCTCFAAAAWVYPAFSR
ncbi:HTH-type transcriptional regulator immR, partial [Dysosmobacter welbionis]